MMAASSWLMIFRPILWRTLEPMPASRSSDVRFEYIRSEPSPTGKRSALLLRHRGGLVVMLLQMTVMPFILFSLMGALGGLDIQSARNLGLRAGTPLPTSSVPENKEDTKVDACPALVPRIPSPVPQPSRRDQPRGKSALSVAARRY